MVSPSVESQFNLQGWPSSPPITVTHSPSCVVVMHIFTQPVFGGNRGYHRAQAPVGGRNVREVRSLYTECESGV